MNYYLKKYLIHKIFVLAFVIGLSISSVAQKAPKGTGFLWRNMEVRPINCTFSPDGSQLACGSWGKGSVENIVIVDSKNGKVVRSFGKKEFGERMAELMAWSNDGSKLAVVTNSIPESDNGERGVLYDIASGEMIRPLDLKEASRLSDVAFSEEGKTVVAVAIPKVYYWSVTASDSAEITTLEMDGYGGESVKLTPSGKQVVTGYVEAILWDPATGKQVRSLENNLKENSHFTSFAFSPDGKFIVATTSDLRSVIWARETGTQEAEFALGSGSAPQGDTQSFLTFRGPDLLAWYEASVGKVQLTKIPLGKSEFVFDAPKVRSEYSGISWDGDRFVFTNLQRTPLALYTLCRDTETCGEPEGLTPSALEKLLPEEAAGLQRAMADSQWGKHGPMAQAVYGSRQKGMEVKINLTTAAEIEKQRPAWEARAKKEGMFKRTYQGRTVYGGGDENRSAVMLPLQKATVSIEGNVPVKQMLKTFNALPLDKIEQITAATE